MSSVHAYLAPEVPGALSASPSRKGLKLLQLSQSGLSGVAFGSEGAGVWWRNYAVLRTLVLGSTYSKLNCTNVMRIGVEEVRGRRGKMCCMLQAVRVVWAVG